MEFFTQRRKEFALGRTVPQTNIPLRIVPYEIEDKYFRDRIISLAMQPLFFKCCQSSYKSIGVIFATLKNGKLRNVNLKMERLHLQCIIAEIDRFHTDIFKATKLLWFPMKLFYFCIEALHMLSFHGKCCMRYVKKRSMVLKIVQKPGLPNYIVIVWAYVP